MTSSAKLEVCNMLHCCQRSTERWSQIMYAENFVKFGRVVFEICKQTDIQMHSLQYFAPLLGGEVICYNKSLDP